MPEILVTKCPICKVLIENKKNASLHLKEEEAISVINEKFPSVKDQGCRFANGGWTVQRDAQWLSDYKKDVESVVERFHKIKFSPWTYGWFRTLNDCGYLPYGIALRNENICKVCFREWGQPYYANNCNHKDKLKAQPHDQYTQLSIYSQESVKS